MKRPSLFLMALTVVFYLAADVAVAQQPDFSGTWTVRAGRGSRGFAGRGGARGGGRGRAAPSANSGSGWGNKFSINQGEETLTIERDLFRPNDLQPRIKVRFAMDGSTVHNEILMGRGIQHQDTVAAWDGDSLILTTTHYYSKPGSDEPLPYDVVQTLSLARSNQLTAPPSLVIETRIDPLPGTEGEAKVTRSTYTRE